MGTRKIAFLLFGVMIVGLPFVGGARVAGERYHFVMEAHSGFREAEVELDPDCLAGVFQWDFYVLDEWLASFCSPWALMDDAYWSQEGIRGQVPGRVTKNVVGFQDVFAAALCEQHATSGFQWPNGPTYGGAVLWASGFSTPVIYCDWLPVEEALIPLESWAHECRTMVRIVTTLLPEQAAQLLDGWEPDPEESDDLTEFPVRVVGYTVPENELIADCTADITRAW